MKRINMRYSVFTVLHLRSRKTKKSPTSNFGFGEIASHYETNKLQIHEKNAFRAFKLIKTVHFVNIKATEGEKPRKDLRQKTFRVG